MAGGRVERGEVAYHSRAISTAVLTVQPAEAAAARRTAGTAAWALAIFEVFGAFIMWLPNPLLWIWIGAQAYEATERMIIGGCVALFGILGSTTLLLSMLTRLDQRWVALRRRAGHDQKEGALNRVVIVSATMGIVGFYIWNFMSKAFIMPFMPMN